MEPKRLKKLVLKKEAISNLNGNQMNRIVGGWGVTTIGNCNSEFTCCTFNYDDDPYKSNTVDPGSCTCEDRCSIDWNSGKSCAYENCGSDYCPR